MSTPFELIPALMVQHAVSTNPRFKMGYEAGQHIQACPECRKKFEKALADFEATLKEIHDHMEQSGT